MIKLNKKNKNTTITATTTLIKYNIGTQNKLTNKTFGTAYKN